LKEYADAERWYQAVFDLKRNEADYALYQWATCKLRQSKYEVAIDKFKEIDEQFDRSEFKDKALLQISNTYLNWLSDHKNALRYAQKLVDEHPRSDLRAKAMLNCGFSASQLDQKGEAITYFKSVLKEYGNQTEEAQVALDELGSLLGTSEINDLLDQFKTQNPETKIKTDNILYKTGRDLYEIQNDPSGAVSQLTKYIQEYPNGTYYYEAHYIRGLANYDLRYPDKALADFAKVYDGKTTPDLASKAYSKTAVIYADQKNYDKAILFYQKAEAIVENNIDRVQIRMAMGEVYYKVKNYADAKERFMQVALDPNTTEYSKGRAQVAWGRALYHLAKMDSAEILFRKVESENKNVFGAESQFWITQIFFDQKKYEDCKNAVFYMKDNYPTQNYWKAKSFILLAEVFRAEKDYFQAVETIKSVAEHSPDDEIKADATKRLEIFEKEANDPNMNPDGFEIEEVELPTNDAQQEDNEDLYDDSEYEAPKKEEKPAPKPVTNNVYKPVPKATPKTESGDKTVIPKKEEPKKVESLKVIEKADPKKEIKPTPTPQKEEPKPTSKPATKYEDKDLGRSEPVVKKEAKTEPAKPKPSEKAELKKEIKPTPATKKEEPKSTSKPATKYEDKDLGRSEPAVKKEAKTEPAKPKPSEKAELKKEVKPTPKKEEAKPTNKSEAKTPAPAKKKTESKEEIKSITYHLIVDQISGTKNAEVAAKKWKDKGFSGVMILQGSKDNEFRISIYYASSKESAEKKKAELLKSQRIGTNAWVMTLTKK
jgi:tetratricopeptide (TPR) repeat protein